MLFVELSVPLVVLYQINLFRILKRTKRYIVSAYISKLLQGDCLIYGTNALEQSKKNFQVPY